MCKEITESGNAADIVHYHKRLIEEHGSGTIEALGWSEREGQQARFKMLSRIGDMSHCSVLDAGCGHADLFAFLRNKYPSLTYYGYEQMPELLNIAAHRYKGEANITLCLGNFLQDSLPVTDFVLASGSLNYRHSDDIFIYKAIETLYAHCRQGLGFNLLGGNDEPESLLVSYDIDKIVSFCQTLSGKTEWHEGYWKDDVTIFVYR